MFDEIMRHFVVSGGTFSESVTAQLTDPPVLKGLVIMTKLKMVMEANLCPGTQATMLTLKNGSPCKL